jgi:hypothetical protein
MTRQHPDPRMSIPISLEIWHQLLSVPVGTGFRYEDWEIAELAIREWMTRHNPDTFGMPETSGYQWKEVFLPDGTLLRTVSNGKNFHCRVEKDQLQYEGRSVSPSAFVNSAGRYGRNAWKSVWILFPTTSTWTLAESLRSKKPRRRRTSPTAR